jgi:hypothetical protein
VKKNGLQKVRSSVKLAAICKYTNISLTGETGMHMREHKIKKAPFENILHSSYQIIR